MEIYFAQIKEDSIVERGLIENYNPARIAIIGSGGCTAFSILADEVENVYCIDLNPAQCALIELKKAAIHNLEREEFLSFLGENSSENRFAQYTKIKAELPAYSREYWEQHVDDINAGINKSGVTEKFYNSISQEILQKIYSEELWKQLFDCKNIEEQQNFYNQYFTTETWTDHMFRLLSKTNHLRFFPAYMFAQAQEDDFGIFFLNQFKKELHTKLVSNNYFLSQFLFGKYLAHIDEGMPFYLTENGYEQTKRNLHKLEIITKPIDEFLYNKNEINAFFLSNLFDWTTAESRTKICKSILKSAANNATLMYRNMLSEPQMPGYFTDRFKENDTLSERCMAMERSMMYRKITVGEII